MADSWFQRIKEGITTSTREKKETPEGLWYKCPSCKKKNQSLRKSMRLIILYALLAGIMKE